MFVGIIRRIDSLGRITVPVEMRNLYMLKKNDTVEIIGTDDGILIRTPRTAISKNSVPTE